MVVIYDVIIVEQWRHVDLIRDVIIAAEGERRWSPIGNKVKIPNSFYVRIDKVILLGFKVHGLSTNLDT